MHSTNYVNTLILVSPDSRATAGTVPQKPGSIAALQFEWLDGRPYTMTSDDLIAGIAALRGGTTADAAFRAAFFARGQACLRASPLVKSHGWGVHADGDARIALIGCETADYARLAADPAVTKVNGMRNRRAEAR